MTTDNQISLDLAAAKRSQTGQFTICRLNKRGLMQEGQQSLASHYMNAINICVCNHLLLTNKNSPKIHIFCSQEVQNNTEELRISVNKYL